MLAAVLSAFIPGLGQIYGGFVGKGAMLLCLNFLIGILNKDLWKAFAEKRIADDDKWIFLAYTLAGLLLTVFAVIDAKIGAERVNRQISGDS